MNVVASIIQQIKPLMLCRLLTLILSTIDNYQYILLATPQSHKLEQFFTIVR